MLAIVALAIHTVTINSVERDVIWIGTDGGGVSRFDPSVPSFMSLTTSDGLPDNRILEIAVAPDGSKIIAAESGVAVYSGP